MQSVFPLPYDGTGEKGGCDMKIPKVFHPILGVLIGFILFLAGIAVLSVVFVGMIKAVEYAKPYLIEFTSVISTLFQNFIEWLQ